MLRDRDPLPLPEDARRQRGDEIAFHVSWMAVVGIVVASLVARCMGC
jgi:hypothetical protein